ncbi:hypothetical protein NE237_009603 [Protea cynaroides]|uniref:WRKY domain-containing protein n=1 Tax=Protea cynaroides TaxID=273540 RepID=A0A9Q0R0G1_9MAGN|nr:hypothetical protein NE237_009603 [Protea cynaroides]
MAANPPPTRGAPLDDTEERLTEERVRIKEDNTMVIIPADGHGWKKYGQKLIKKINKTRSYFRCHKMNCRAKKRVEWSTSNPGNLQISYEGTHVHPQIGTPDQQGSSQEEASASRVNQYDLYTQVFGDHQNN